MVPLDMAIDRWHQGEPFGINYLGFWFRTETVSGPNPGHPWMQKSEISKKSVLDVLTWPTVDWAVASFWR